MKTKILLFGFSCLIPFFVGCNKDSSDDSSGNFRVKSMVSFYNSSRDDSSAVVYDGNKIKLVKNFVHEGTWMESGKSDVTYTDKTITIIDSDKEGDSWAPEYKMVMTVENNLIKELIEFDRNEAKLLVEDDKNVFIYEGTVLKKIENYDKNGTTWAKNHETVFAYLNGLVSKIESKYIGSNSSEIDTFTYDGSKIQKITKFDIESLLRRKSFERRFTYSGSMVAKIDDYYWDSWNSNSWVLDETNTYKYDSNNNLIEILNSYGSENYKLIYTYEAGTGNMAEISNYLDQTGLYGKPVLKGTNKSPGFKQVMKHMKFVQ